MQIKKEYKFYAGHRNQDLEDKCMRPHGHHYKLFIYFNVVRSGSISTLFGDFDCKIEPLLKDQFDHRLLLDKNDPLKIYLDLYEQETGNVLGCKVLDRPSSVENVAFELFKECSRFGFNIEKIELQETVSSTLVYTKQDYANDINSFESELSKGKD